MRQTLTPYSATNDYGAMLLKVAQHLANGLGVTLEPTSHIRDSTTHSRGDALDLAPRFPEEFDYAGSRMSDPLLSYRMPLVKAVNEIMKTAPYSGFLLIENNHFHVLLGKWITKGSRWRIAVQKDQRYPDSAERASSYLMKFGQTVHRTDYNGRRLYPTPDLPIDTIISVSKGADGHWSRLNIDHSYLLS